MLNIAIMGLGYIAQRVAQGIIHSNNSKLYGIASRDIKKAKNFALHYEVQEIYGSYEEMLQNPKIDLVYICTPNTLHVEHIKMCLSFHKHVICEKPLCSSSEEIISLFAYAKEKRCFLMEAEKTIFTPLNQQIKKMIESGVIGNLKMIDASYCDQMEFIDYDKNRWNFDARSGGSLFDVGVYPICFANYYAHSDIKKSHVIKTKNHNLPCDFNSCAIIQYENGVLASIRSSWDVKAKNRGTLYGEEGYIEFENFWKNTKATLIKGSHQEEINVEMKSDFTGEIEHAINCIEEGLLESPMLGEQQSLQIMKVIEG